MSTTESSIYDLLKDAVSNDINNYSIIFHGANKKGEGYLGKINYVSLKDKTNGNLLHLVVKEAFSDEEIRTDNAIKSYYLNEIYFYDKVWPVLQKFQTEIPSVKPFDKIPKCFGTTSEDKEEKLALENLRYQDFATFDKRGTFDREHVEYILKQYGRLHAISFAYKQLYPEEYLEVSKGLKELWSKLCEGKGFDTYITYIHELCLKSLDPEEDAEAIEKYKHYVEDGAKIFFNSSIYKGNYSVILHGDCWSNNLMFKYDFAGSGTLSQVLGWKLSISLLNSAATVQSWPKKGFQPETYPTFSLFHSGLVFRFQRNVTSKVVTLFSKSNNTLAAIGTY